MWQCVYVSSFYHANLWMDTSERVSIDFRFMVEFCMAFKRVRKWMECDKIHHTSETIQYTYWWKKASTATHVKLNLCLYSSTVKRSIGTHHTHTHTHAIYVYGMSTMKTDCIHNTRSTAVKLLTCEIVFRMKTSNRLGSIDHKLLLFCHWNLNAVCSKQITLFIYQNVPENM